MSINLSFSAILFTIQRSCKRFELIGSAGLHFYGTYRYVHHPLGRDCYSSVSNKNPSCTFLSLFLQHYYLVSFTAQLSLATAGLHDDGFPTPSIDGAGGKLPTRCPAQHDSFRFLSIDGASSKRLAPYAVPHSSMSSYSCP